MIEIQNLEKLLAERGFGKLSQQEAEQIFYDACFQERVDIVNLILEHDEFDLIDNTRRWFTLSRLCGRQKWAVIPRLMQDKRFDPSELTSVPLINAVLAKNAKIVQLFLQDRRVDPNEGIHACPILLQNCFDSQYDAILDILLVDLRTDLQNLPCCIDRIGQVHSRMTIVCIGLQDLQLPALVTLEILDALVPNDIRMAAKWDLIVAVKHFHDRGKL